MTTRKVTLIGRSHCITLPKEFAKELDLEKGEELYIDLAGNVVWVGRVESMAQKEPIKSICKLLSDAVKIRLKLTQNIEKYEDGELTAFQFASETDDFRKSLKEIEDSIKRLQKEKVDPLKKEFRLKFISPQVTSKQLLVEIRSQVDEAHDRALDELYAEIRQLFKERDALKRVVEHVSQIGGEFDEKISKDLDLVRTECGSRFVHVERICKRISELIKTEV